jgi:hypothetical protein
MRRPLALVVLLGLTSCGTTLGTIPFSAPGSGRVVVNLDAGKPVDFWSNFDAQYTSTPATRYDIALMQDGVVVSTAVCDPIASRIGPHRACVTHSEVGTAHYGNCIMHCSAYVPRTGPTEVRASFYLAGDVYGLQLDRANLIIKQ